MIRSIFIFLMWTLLGVELSIAAVDFSSGEQFATMFNHTKWTTFRDIRRAALLFYEAKTDVRDFFRAFECNCGRLNRLAYKSDSHIAAIAEHWPVPSSQMNQSLDCALDSQENSSFTSELDQHYAVIRTTFIRDLSKVGLHFFRHERDNLYPYFLKALTRIGLSEAGFKIYEDSLQSILYQEIRKY